MCCSTASKSSQSACKGKAFWMWARAAAPSSASASATHPDEPLVTELAVPEQEAQDQEVGQSLQAHTLMPASRRAPFEGVGGGGMLEDCGVAGSGSMPLGVAGCGSVPLGVAGWEGVGAAVVVGTAGGERGGQVGSREEMQCPRRT